MDRISVDLKHCYGIKSLQQDFDFSKTAVYAIYAANGVMKSSLAETFLDASKRAASSDRVFPDRETTRHIVDEHGAEVEGERVLVIPSYDQEFLPTEKTSTLLVSADLRRESEELEAQVEAAKSALLKAISLQAGSKKDFGRELSTALTRREDQLENAVLRIRREIERQTEAPFAAVPYDIVFNEKVQKALGDNKLMAVIEDYVQRYNELLAASNYFRRGTFDYYNAGQIAKSLAENGFFNAHHTVNLYGAEETVEIKTEKQLEELIEGEKQAILTDQELRKRFDNVQKQLSKNAELRQFCQYLQDHEAVLSRMSNVEAFREDVLKSYIKVNEPLYDAYVNTIEAVDRRRKEIIEVARKQTTEWDTVLRIFNERFFVPFELVAVNKFAVMLGQEHKPTLGFKYKDGREEVDVTRDTLLKVLSMGERKALYIVNVIFEIRRRMKDSVETLVVVDDIADSFDYNNKYAIIHYLQEISSQGQVKLIIMTHNFDFFRTIISRFVGYGNGLMASKNQDGVTLVKASGIRNVFANDWKKEFFTNERKQVASIPFLRNIIEMTKGEDDPNYLKLTSVLHWRPDTTDLTVADIDLVFNELCGTDGASREPGRRMIDVIMAEAEACLVEEGALRLENKIVLAMGIRLAADSFLIRKIDDQAWVAGLKQNQTRHLLKRFRKAYADEETALSVLDRVELMTPENIHVNAFMYEPIIDMSDDHLRTLFADIRGL
jgi:hypothetical protein